MRIILLESIPQISSDDIATWNRATEPEKAKLLPNIIKGYNNNDLFNIREAIRAHLYQNGIDPKKNTFMVLMDKVKFPITKDHAEYFRKLLDLYNSDNIDMSRDYLANKSLYERNIKDFIYTVQLFDIVNEPIKLRNFFKDTTRIKESDLYVDGTTTIKPVGKDGDGTDTLFGTVESWGGDEGKNNASYDEMEKGGYSLTQALQQLKVPQNGYSKIIEIWLQKYWKEAVKLYEPKQSQDMQHFLKMLQFILGGEIKRLPDRELAKIKNRYTYSTAKDIPRSLYSDGTIVFLKEIEHTGDANIDMSDKNQINDFVIYSGNKWIKYDEYLKPRSKDNANLNKAYNTLFNQKVIKDKGNKVSIVAGIIEILDYFDMYELQSNKRYDLYDYR